MEADNDPGVKSWLICIFKTTAAWKMSFQQFFWLMTLDSEVEHRHNYWLSGGQKVSGRKKTLTSDFKLTGANAGEKKERKKR